MVVKVKINVEDKLLDALVLFNFNTFTYYSSFQFICFHLQYNTAALCPIDLEETTQHPTPTQNPQVPTNKKQQEAPPHHLPKTLQQS